MASQAQKALKQCLADGIKTKTQCYADFQKATGATAEGGKVFVTPDGEATSVTTGGKVFNGGKVF
jgi:hypothetical protein